MGYGFIKERNEQLYERALQVYFHDDRIFFKIYQQRNIAVS